MSRTEMMDKIINRFGFECDLTITFCTIAEQSTSDKTVRELFSILMK